MTGVVVADDHAMIRAGLRAVIEGLPGFHLLAEADTGERAVAAVVEHRPDVVVMDLHMPGMDGFEATRRIRRMAPGTAVLVVTMDEQDAALFGALRAGACGYLPKDADYQQVSAALVAAGSGQAVFGASARDRILDLLGKLPPATGAAAAGLTERETDVLGLLAAGLGTQEVARRLGLSPKTVRNHVSAVLVKLQLGDRAEAIAWARTVGLPMAD